MATDNLKLTKARAVFENKVYALMNDLDKTGYNADRWKAIFSKMSNAQFIDYMKRMSEDKETNLNIDYNFSGTENQDFPTTEKLTKIAEKYKVPLAEHVIFPNSNPDKSGKGAPAVSKGKLIVIPVVCRKLVQMLHKKNNIVNDISVVNTLTNEATGSSKSTGIGNTQTHALNVTQELNTIKELHTVRSADNVGKKQMYAMIEESGSFKLNDIKLSPYNMQSVKTYRDYMRAIGIELEFR